MKFNLKYCVVERALLSVLLFSLHNYYLAHKIGFYNSFLLIILLSIMYSFFITKKDNVEIVTIKEFTNGLLCILYLILITVLVESPNIIHFTSILIQQASYEELFFRLFIIGSNKKYFSIKSKKELLIILIVSNYLFAINHPYDIIGKINMFVIGFLFSYIYLLNGIISVIISHSIWNLYVDFLIKGLLISPLILVPAFSPLVKRLYHKLVVIFRDKRLGIQSWVQRFSRRSQRAASSCTR